jgi:hypothetical protein
MSRCCSDLSFSSGADCISPSGLGSGDERLSTDPSVRPREAARPGRTSGGSIVAPHPKTSRRATMPMPGQAQTTYTWDNANRLTGIINLADPSGRLNVIVGVGISLAGLTGAEASGGIFFNPGWFGQQANAGVFGTGGGGGGVNVSADVFGGVIFGGAGNVSGSTLDINLVLGPISVTLLTNPSTGDVVGATVGWGPSATPIGVSGTYEVTGTLSLRPLHSRLCQ